MLTPVGGEGATFAQRRIGAEAFSCIISRRPHLFDPAVPFGLSLRDSTLVALIVYQLAARDDISAKTRSRLKAMGGGGDDPRSWVTPKRCAFDPEEVKAGGGSVRGSRITRAWLAPVTLRRLHS